MNTQMSGVQTPSAMQPPAQGNVPPARRSKKWFVIVIATLLIAAGGGAYFLYSQRTNQGAPGAPVKGFVLEAKTTDAAGTDPNTSFILRSEHNLQLEKVKEMVHFTPTVDFSVTKVAQRSHVLQMLVHAVFAKGPDETGASFSYELKPAAPLLSDTVYQATLAASDLADHEYSWAFQIKAPFQVIGTTPRDKGTYVPINTGIEITMNREDFLDPQDYFSIEPKVDGTFEQHGDTFVFLPKKLDPKSIYKVTVKKGMSVRGSGDTLTTDHTFVFETADTEYQGSAPQFDFNDSFIEALPGKQPVAAVSSYNFESQKLQATLYQFQNDGDFLNAYKKSRRWEYWWSYFYRTETGSTFDPSGLQKVLTFAPVIQQSNYLNYFEVPQVLQAGYYFIDAEFDGHHRQAWLQITPLAHYFSISHDNGLLWMYDYQKKAPISGAQVGYIDTETKNLGTTDSTGLVEFTTPDSLRSENKGDAGPQFFKVSAEGYMPLITRITDNWGYQQRAIQGDKYWQFLSTDRYTYALSDAVKFWGVVKGRTLDMRQRKVSVGIYPSSYAIDFRQGAAQWMYRPPYGDQAKPLITQELMISNFDTIQGELMYRGLTPGTYNLIVMSGDEMISNASFEVLSYTKPAYQIMVSSDKQAIFAGDEVTFKVKANFFDTTPVAGLELNYNAYWDQALAGKVKLNGDGEGTVTLKPAYNEREGDYYPRQLNIGFSPALSEEGEISGSATILVFGPHMYLQTNSKNKPGTATHTFTAKLNDIVLDKVNDAGNFGTSEYIGNPVTSYPMTASIKRITYTPVETGQYYDPINKIVQKIYDYRRSEAVVESLNGSTDSNGEWSFERTLQKKNNEWYEVIFTGKDRNGRALLSTTYPYEYQPYYNSGAGGGTGFAIELHFADKPLENKFSIGDQVKLEIEVKEGGLQSPMNVLFYRYQGSIAKTTIAHGLTYDETFDKVFLPSVQYRAVVFGPYGFVETNEVVASFKSTDNALDVSMQTDKPQYRPGDTVNMTIGVADKDKKPVSAEVNISAVDEALFHILPFNWQAEILPTLFHDIYTQLITGSSEFRSLEQQLSKDSAGAEFGGCFTGDTQITMVGGSSKPIADVKVGDMVITRASERSKTKVGAIVQGISQHYVDDLVIINGSLEVTPEHELYVNNTWLYAGLIKPGDVMIGKDGTVKKVTSVKRERRPHTAVYNIVVGSYHTYFAGSYYVHNAEKGGSPRANFVDVALYKSVHTDDKGSASIQFTAPDNITSWRITSLAYASDNLQAGQNVKLVPTTLPFFVDSTLNSTYLVGDFPSVRLRAFGTNAITKDKKTSFGVKSDSLKIDTKQDVLANTAYIPLTRLTEGEHAITLSAQQESNQDSMIKKITVVKNYFRKGEAADYVVSDALTGIQGNDDAFTDLVFMDKGRARFYYPLKSQTYWTGIRADQQAASYFGQKLLAQYFKEAEPDEQLDLSRYQTEEGAVSLFPYSDSDLELTAKMADLAPDFLYQDSVKRYLRTSLEDKKADIHRIAKALYGLASLHEPVLTRVQAIKGNTDLTLEDTTYVALALAKLGDRESARILYEQKIRPQIRFEGGQGWLANEQDVTHQVKWTSMIGVLSSYLKEKEDTSMIWNYVNTHWPERDLHLLEKTLLMKSELPQTTEAAAKFTYSAGSKGETVALEKGNTYSLTLSPDERKNIHFSNVEGSVGVVSFYERSEDPSELKLNAELSIKRSYLVNNKETKTFKEGDIVKVRLLPTIAKTALDGTYQVVDFVPSGLKPIMQLYEKGWTDQMQYDECNPIWYPTKIVGQAMYFTVYKGFDTVPNCKQRTLNYYARVVSRGDFAANPALLQSMQDVQSLNISEATAVQVVQ